MPLRNRNGKWHYRFKLDGRAYNGTTGLAATKQNERAAQDKESERRTALREGHTAIRRILIRQFDDAAEEFLEWAKMEYREHPNSYRRVATSFASAKQFFGVEPVSTIDAGRIEAYKTERVTIHEIRDVTLRHDLHALSKFFGYAKKRHWTRENPVREVTIPSDEDAIRIHVVTADEEKYYFGLAAKHTDLHDLGRLVLNQGARPGEIVCLRKNDVELERGKIAIRMGKSPAARRSLNLTAESRAILARRMSGVSPWIFPSPRNPQRHIARLNGVHDRLCRKAQRSGNSLKFVLYDFRHTFATRMAETGVDLATIAAILGHNSLRIVKRYVHPTAEHQKAAMLRYEVDQKARVQRAGRPN